MAPMFVIDRLWPDPATDLELDTAFADLALPAPPPDRPWIGLNMVTSLDGRAQRDGTADGIGDRADRRLMRLLRVPYDAVAIGIGTLRAVDGWTDLPTDLAEARVAAGRPLQPLAVLIAGVGSIPTDGRWFTTDQPRLVVVGRDGPREVDGAEVVVAPAVHPEADWVAGALHERGIRSVLLEGGPTVNARFHAAGLIDELYWTVGPWLLGGEGLPMIAPDPPVQSPRPATLVSVHRHGDELFLHYRFVSGSSG
jgi:2,5-diamino-6-(ribosylamino)-4(3H)-pyrimidinone 5'-phosphate reductase